MPKRNVRIYGPILQDVQDDVRAQLDEIPRDEPINVQIASPGGFAHMGVTIYNWLKQYDSVNIKIEGDVMSAATVITSAGDYVEMPDNAMLMIHRPFVMGAMGDADELRKEADYLEKVEENVVKIYHSKTRMASGMISRLMKSETYFDAKEAMARGFVDNVTGGKAGMAHKKDEYLVQKPEKLAEMLASRPVYRDQTKLKELLRQINE